MSNAALVLSFISPLAAGQSTGNKKAKVQVLQEHQEAKRANHQFGAAAITTTQNGKNTCFKI